MLYLLRDRRRQVRAAHRWWHRVLIINIVISRARGVRSGRVCRTVFKVVYLDVRACVRACDRSTDGLTDRDRACVKTWPMTTFDHSAGPAFACTLYTVWAVKTFESLHYAKSVIAYFGIARAVLHSHKLMA